MSSKNQAQFENRYQELNAKQKEAVDNTEGPILVIAGPGSGKTELLALRTANILKSVDNQATPGNILLLTFTDNGAKNMRERIIELIGEDGYRVAIYTFHAFASEIMHNYSEYFFAGADFRVATEVEILNILEDILDNLPRENILASKHIVMGYTYASSLRTSISALKKGDLTGEEFKEKIKENESEYQEINSRVAEYLASIAGKSKSTILLETYSKIYEELDNLAKETNAVAQFLMDSLGKEIAQAELTEKAKNLTTWKSKYFTKNEEGEFILKDSAEKKVEKWLALAEVYEKYNQKMHELGLYDFDDMIFKVGRELNKNVALRNELEERYQYIMLDEFQDTSDAQFSLIYALTKSEVNEGRPNILAVGDDDQAIFKFQGAELDNITKFLKTFKDVKVITLLKNYRSTQNILDRARKVIVKIDDRLENRLEYINKNIIASNEKLLQKFKGEILEKSFENSQSEYDYVAREISTLIKKGVNPEEISVIARSHSNLKNIANIFNEYEIPYTYEREENVFEQEPIQEIITIVKFVSSGLEATLREDLLPDILSYKFWGIERLEIWKIAEKIRSENYAIDESGNKLYKKSSWLKTMLESENSKIQNIAKFLIDLMAEAKALPLLHLIDKIIGSVGFELDEINAEDREIEIKEKTLFLSPFRNYYFGKKNFVEKKIEYLDFLLALQTFINALREYKNGKVLYAKDIEEFVGIYENNKNLVLSTVATFKTASQAVVLQTAHKSKGLEYEYVFIVNSDEKEWAVARNKNKIGLPMNLPLLANQDDLSDSTRLYYVAMTRAKHTLYITNNKIKFSVLSEDMLEDTEKLEKEKSFINDKLVNSLYPKVSRPLVKEERALLANILEKYKMPVTHLINYLDISKSGPEEFLERNLLRFPQAISPSSVYGTAVHEAIHGYYKYKKVNGKNPDLDRIISFFKNSLQRGNLTEIDFQKYYTSGVKNLEIFTSYLKNLKEVGEIETERDFKNEGSTLENVPITGKLDKILIVGEEVELVDFKTGKSLKSWEDNSSEYEKIKLHFYKYQLAFYVLLLKNSRSYAKKKIKSLAIQFVEADNKNQIHTLTILPSQELEKLLERAKKLTTIVYQKILKLDFPETTLYKISEQTKEAKENLTLKDIERFEEDLLNGKI